MNPAGDPPMQTYQTEPEPEGSTFESVDAFLQAKLESDDAEVAGAAQAALALEEEEDEDEDEGPPPEDPLFPIDAQGHATVPEGETELPENAFSCCASLISITLPASLTRIGVSAFDGCRRLGLTSLPHGLTSIGDGAFRGCTSLGPHVFGRVLRTSTLSDWGDSYCMCHCQIG